MLWTDSSLSSLNGLWTWHYILWHPAKGPGDQLDPIYLLLPKLKQESTERRGEDLRGFRSNWKWKINGWIAPMAFLLGHKVAVTLLVNRMSVRGGRRAPKRDGSRTRGPSSSSESLLPGEELNHPVRNHSGGSWNRYYSSSKFPGKFGNIAAALWKTQIDNGRLQDRSV